MVDRYSGQMDHMAHCHPQVLLFQVPYNALFAKVPLLTDCCAVRWGVTSLQVGFLPRTLLFVLFCSQFSIFLSYDSTPIFLNADLSELPCPPRSHLLNPNVYSYSLARSSRKVLCSGSFCPISRGFMELHLSVAFFSPTPRLQVFFSSVSILVLGYLYYQQ